MFDRNRRTLVLLGLFALTLLAAPVASARGLTPWDVARLRSVGSVAIAPDGAHVAYVLSVPREPMVDDNGPAWAELHVLDTATGESHPFVTGEVNVSGVQFAGGGRWITFLAKRGGDEFRALYAIAVDGGEARRVLAWKTDIAEYALRPDGGRLVFLAEEPETEERKAQKEQGFDMEVYEEQSEPKHLYVADLDLQDWRAGDALDAREIGLDGHPADLQYSPVGERVLLTLAPSAHIDDRYMKRQYAVISLDDGSEYGRIETEGKLGAAAFSPDGRAIAFVGPASLHDPAAGRLFVAPANGGTPVELLPDFEGHVRSVAWSDAKHVLYLADVHVHTEVGRVPAKGGKAEVLVGEGETLLSGLHVSADGRTWAFTGESPAHPNELYVGPVGRTPERRTDSNPWLAGIELAEQHVHTWVARDGLELEGVLINPLGYEHGRRYPLLVVVHGGPESHERNGWKTWYSRPGQFGAAEGYFVWYPNYRGSTGRGVDFSLLSQGDPGGAEFDDIVDGVDDLVAGGLVDPDRVGITGGSYGGYATAWGATRYSEKYAAAVMFVGISEQYSKFGTTDIPIESQLVHQYPRKVFDDWQFFLERSPIYHAKGSKTPLLILHGKADPRVHPTQSMIMYRYFQQQADAPVRLVWYPGEGHGNRKAAGRLDYSLRMMRWMDHFLLEGASEKPPFEIDHQEPGSAEPEGAAATSRAE